MANKFTDTTAKLFPLGCRPKPDGVCNIRVRKDLRDQQEHLQSNFIEEEVSQTTIRNEEMARQPGDVCSGEMTRCNTVHIVGGSVYEEHLRGSFITSTLLVNIKTMWEV
jgi:hypothetical protein